MSRIICPPSKTGDKTADRKDIQVQITASTTTIQELHEELQMLESHFVAQKSNEKSEPGKTPQEEKIKVGFILKSSNLFISVVWKLCTQYFLFLILGP